MWRACCRRQTGTSRQLSMVCAWSLKSSGVPIIGIIVAAQSHQFSVKFEVSVCASRDNLQKSEETDFKIKVARANLILGAV